MFMAHKLYFPNAVCLIVIVLFPVTYRNGLTCMKKDWFEYIMYAMYPFDIWTMCYICWVCMFNQSTAHSHACLVCNGMQASIHQCFSMLDISFQTQCKHLIVSLHDAVRLCLPWLGTDYCYTFNVFTFYVFGLVGGKISTWWVSDSNFWPILYQMPGTQAKCGLVMTLSN